MLSQTPGGSAQAEALNVILLILPGIRCTGMKRKKGGIQQPDTKVQARGQLHTVKLRLCGRGSSEHQGWPASELSVF